MKVLHILWHGDIGGAERAVYQLAREQLHDPELAPAMAFARSGGYYWEQAGLAGIPVLSFDLPDGQAVTKIPGIARLMHGYDILHFQSAEPLLMTASLFCPEARRVYTHRGGRFSYPFKKRLQYAYVGFLLRVFNGLSANTSHAADFAARLFHMPLRRFDVTYNGLDFDLLQPVRSPVQVRQALGLSENHFVVGTSANLRAWKRIDRLIRAVADLSVPNFRLLIVGDGPDRSRLEALTHDLHVRDKVIFSGMQNNVADYLQVMDAFCLPSTDSESFGNAVVEAMAFGLPGIVFADGGGLVEHIIDGKTGFIVKDQNELESTLSDLLADSTLCRRIGVQARENIRSRYTLTASAEAYKKLYLAAFTVN